MSPLQKHTAAFATATATVTNGSANAYQEANSLHEQELVALAVINYDKNPKWNPADYAKPLLNQQQLTARTQVLDALKTYAETIADLASTGNNTALDTAATDAGNNLQSLSSTVSTSFSTAVPKAELSDTEKNILSTALVALGDFLKARTVKKELPTVLEKNDPNIASVCKILSSDVGILRRQADIDYGILLDAQDQYIRHAGNSLTPSEKRTEIAKLPAIVVQQQQNDQLLSQLQKAIEQLALTHHALAAAAQGNNPESIQQYIADLSAEGQTLSAYYQSLSSTPSSK